MTKWAVLLLAMSCGDAPPTSEIGDPLGDLPKPTCSWKYAWSPAACGGGRVRYGCPPSDAVCEPGCQLYKYGQPRYYTDASGLHQGAAAPGASCEQAEQLCVYE